MIVPAFYPILDTAAVLARDLDPVRAAQDILDGGARILQFRHKGFLSRQAYGWLESIAGLAREAGVPLVVNDRADLAKLFGAALHVGQDDLPPAAARSLIGTLPLGFSTHNEAQLSASNHEPIDYVALGPIFGTATKENPDATVGLEELRRIRNLSTLPLVAIGGITRATAPAVIEAGANSVAIIADLFPNDGDLRRRTQEWIRLLTPNS